MYKKLKVKLILNNSYKPIKVSTLTNELDVI